MLTPKLEFMYLETFQVLIIANIYNCHSVIRINNSATYLSLYFYLTINYLLYIYLPNIILVGTKHEFLFASEIGLKITKATPFGVTLKRIDV